MLDTRGMDKVLEQMIPTMEEGPVKEAFKKVLAETDEKVAQLCYDRLNEAYGVGVDIKTVDLNYLFEGKTTFEKIDTYGLEKVVHELIQVSDNTDLVEALKVVYAENDVAKAQEYFKRLAECWSANGNISCIDPKYLLSGTLE